MTRKLEIKPGDMFGCQKVVEEVEPVTVNSQWGPAKARRFLCICICGAVAEQYIAGLRRYPRYCVACVKGTAPIQRIRDEEFLAEMKRRFPNGVEE